MQLLEDALEKAIQQGKIEAAEYDKFACFCQEQSTQKQGSIEKAGRMLKVLGARIEELEGDIPKFNDDIKVASDQIVEYGKEIKVLTDERTKERALYKGTSSEFFKAIKGCKEALAAIQARKAQMKEVDFDDFHQIKASSHKVLMVISNKSSIDIPPAQVLQLRSLLQMEDNPGQPKTYTYQSGKIIELLRDMYRTMEKQLDGIENTELESRFAFERKVGNLNNLKKITEDEKAHDSEHVDDMTVELSESKSSQARYQKDSSVDETALKEMVLQCEDKAKDWDVKSASRQAEITALTNAINVMKEKVVPAFLEQRRLAEIQMVRKQHRTALMTVPDGVHRNVTHHTGTNRFDHSSSSNSSYAGKASVGDHVVRKTDTTQMTVSDGALVNSSRTMNSSSHDGTTLLHEHTGPQASLRKVLVVKSSDRGATSFLQLRQLTGETSAKVAEETAKQLAAAGKKLQSQALIVASAKVASAKDNFVRARQMIRDILSKLEAAAEAEANQKGFCDKAMGDSMTQRDKTVAQVEQLSAKVYAYNAEKDKLTKEIAEFASEIAALKKGLNEATELRNTERANNERAIAAAQEGISGCNIAMAEMKSFYGSSLLQAGHQNEQRDDSKRAEADANSNNEKDGDNIIALLEVVLSDFERILSRTTKQEDKAQTDFLEFEKTSNADIKEKSDSKAVKDVQMTAVEDKLMGVTGNLNEQQSLLDDAKKALSGLKKQCVNAQENYADKRAKRAAEIAQLRETAAYLDSYSP